MKSEEEVKTRFACIGTAAFSRKVKVTMIILMKTVIFICRGRYSKCRDIQEQTGTDKNRQGQTRISKDKHGQGQEETSRDRRGRSLFVPACPCFSQQKNVCSQQL